VRAALRASGAAAKIVDEQDRFWRHRNGAGSSGSLSRNWCTCRRRPEKWIVSWALSGSVQPHQTAGGACCRTCHAGVAVSIPLTAGQQRPGQIAPRRWGGVFPIPTQSAQSGAADRSGVAAASTEADRASSPQAITTSRPRQKTRSGRPLTIPSSITPRARASRAGRAGRPFSKGSLRALSPGGFLPVYNPLRRGSTSVAWRSALASASACRTMSPPLGRPG
jgi:hypothetical protein